MKFQTQLLKLIKRIIIISMLIFLFVLSGVYGFYSYYVDRESSKRYLNILTKEFETIIDNTRKFFEINKNKELIDEYIKYKNTSVLKSLGYDMHRSTGIHANISIYDIEHNNIGENSYFELGENLYYFIKYLSGKKFSATYANYISQTSESILIMKKSIVYEGSNIGYLVTSIPSSEIQKNLNTNEFRYVIEDKFNKTLVNTIGYRRNVNKFNIDELSPKYEISSSSMYGFNIHVFVPKSFSLKNLIIFEIIFMLPTFLIILVMEVLTRRTIKKETESVVKLLNQIEDIKNQKLKKLDIRDEEYSKIANAINELIISIEDLTKKTSDLQYANKISELKRMQSHFNAHFLYNTLELIRTLMYIDIDKTNKVIYDFSSLLRYSLNNLNIIRLSEDITYIKKFMDISKIKYNRGFTYTINISDVDIIVPKLFLQPFIENSIKYGFCYKDRVDIDIIARETEEQYIFDIIDSGEPLSDEKILEINSSINKNDDNLQRNDHHGIINSINRLRLIYKEVHAGFIESDKVHFRIEISRRKDV